jgi:hypothetical protein
MGPMNLPEADRNEELHKETDMAVNWRRAWAKAVVGLIFAALLGGGCGGMQPLQDQVTTEYLLNQAGFTKYKPNMETPKTQALLDALPEGQVTTFKTSGTVYHAYPDKRSNVLYVGDQAAYDKYAAMAQGKKLCQRVEAPDSAGFWGCFQEMQQKGTR